MSMNNQEDIPGDTPEAPVQITITEEENINDNAPLDANESVADENQIENDEKENENEEEALQTPKVPGLDSHRPSIALQIMDQEHSWLSELEKKCTKLETAFISKIQYVAISNHCQKYLEKVSSDESMLQFRTEYFNLFEKFRTAFTGSQQLYNKLKENKVRTKIANKEIRTLKIELEGKNREMEELEKRLARTQDELSSMVKQKSALQRMFNEWQEEKKYEELKEQESDKKLKDDEAEEAREKIDKLEEQLEFLNKELEFTKQRENVHRNKVQLIDEQKAAIENELSSAKYDLQKQITRAEKAEAIILEKTEELNNKNAIIKTMAEETKQIKMDLQRSQEEAKRLLKEQRQKQKDLDRAKQIIEKLRKDFDVREDRIKMLANQSDVAEIELNNKRAEVYALKVDIANVTKEKNILVRKAALLEDRCTDAEIKLESTKKENAARQKELDLLAKELDDSVNKARDLIKQKDALSEAVLKHDQTIADLRGELKVEQEKSDQLDKELKTSKRFADGLRDDVKRLEKTKKRLMKDVVELNTTIVNLRGEITRLNFRISEMEKTEAKLRQQLRDEQIKIRRIADDERHCRKLLTEAKHENEQLHREQIVLQKYIEQLQSLTQGQEEECKKLDINIKSLTEQLGMAKELHRQEIKNTDELSAKLKRKDDQEQLLLENKVHLEHKISDLERRIKNLQEENNVQNSKLISKEREIKDLKENIRLLQQQISQLDKSVNERNEDIKLLKFHIAEITRRNALMDKQLENAGIVREELGNVHNRLLEEKCKSKALEDEVQRPVNLHRWRILEGTDPERAQLIVKNQALQKQLIHKMKELDDKEVELQEKVKQNEELQEQLRRRSEVDYQEQLWACKKELSARIERVKCLSAENTMFQNLFDKYRNEIVVLKEELRKYKMDEMNAKISRKRKSIM